MKKLVVCLTALSVFVLAGSAPAAAIYKINNSNNLNLTTSWSTTSGAQTPNPGSIGTGDIAYFNEATMLGDKTVSLGGNLTIGGMALDWVTADTSNNLTINSGSTLTLNGGTIYGSGKDGAGGTYTAAGIVLNRGTGGTMTVNCDVALGAAQQWVISRNLTVGGAISLGSYQLDINVAGGTMALNGVISGTAGVNKKAGAATLTLGNTGNTFSGQVTLVGGTTTVTKLATIGNNSSLGTGSGASSIILNGATLTYNGAGGDTTDRAIDMRAGATINNNSATGTISFTAANVIQGGTASARAFTLGGTNTGANTFGSILGDSGTGANITTLTKNNAGTWVITGANTYTGTTYIQAGGILRVTGSGVLGGKAGSTGAAVIANNIDFTGTAANSTLEFETAANLGPSSQVCFRTTGGGPGVLRYIGTTAQTVSKGMQCDTSQAMRIESNSVGGYLTINGDFTYVTGNRNIFLGGSGTGDNTLASSIANDGSGKLTKDGTGTWILSGSNTYTGGNELLGGTLVVDALSRLGNRTAGGDNTGYLAIKTGGTFRYTGTGSESTARRLYMDNGAATIEVLNSGATLTWNDDSDSAKTGNFTKTGAGTLVMDDPLTGTGQTVTANGGLLTLNASNTYTGATQVSAGTLRLDGSVTSAVTVDSGARLQGVGTITKSGTALTVNGTLAPGNSIGQLTVNGDVTLAGTSDFEINQDTTTADLLKVQGTNGALTWGGILNVTTLGTGAYTLYQTFNMFDFTSQSGTFSSVTLPSLAGQPGYSWDTSALYTAGTITVIPEPATVGMIGLVGMMALLRRRMKIRG